MTTLLHITNSLRYDEMKYFNHQNIYHACLQSLRIMGKGSYYYYFFYDFHKHIICFVQHIFIFCFNRSEKKTLNGIIKITILIIIKSCNAEAKTSKTSQLYIGIKV